MTVHFSLNAPDAARTAKSADGRGRGRAASTTQNSRYVRRKRMNNLIGNFQTKIMAFDTFDSELIVPPASNCIQV